MTFDYQLNQLLQQVLLLGSMVEQAVIQAMEALQRRDHAAARRVFAGDLLINDKRYDIENECVRLIATQQPMARDARFLAAILEIITELERIGDYAKGIGKITLLLGEEAIDPAMLADLDWIAGRGLDMLRRSLASFVSGDAGSARAIPDEDDDVDRMFASIYQRLTQQIIDQIITFDHASRLIWAAHNLERLADRVTNICERTIYVATGTTQELDRGFEIAD